MLNWTMGKEEKKRNLILYTHSTVVHHYRRARQKKKRRVSLVTVCFWIIRKMWTDYPWSFLVKFKELSSKCSLDRSLFVWIRRTNNWFVECVILSVFESDFLLKFWTSTNNDNHNLSKNLFRALLHYFLLFSVMLKESNRIICEEHWQDCRETLMYFIIGNLFSDIYRSK